MILAFQLNELIDAAIRLIQALLKPTQRQAEGGILPAERTSQLRDKCAVERRGGANHVRQNHDQVPGLFLGHLQHAFGPQAGRVAVSPAGRNAHGNSTQALDQREAQHDRNGPQFAELERAFGLVSGHEPAEVVSVYAPVDVRNQLEGDGIDARIPGQRAAHESG